MIPSAGAKARPFIVTLRNGAFLASSVNQLVNLCPLRKPESSEQVDGRERKLTSA